jgi:hypothetical protein
MAKSIRFEELEATGHSKENQVTGHFWEQWFHKPSPMPQPSRNLDEHSIWEKAIHFGILAAEKAKC